MKAVRGHRYLARRGQVLYFRRSVPKDVQLSAFDGKPEEWKSLRTTDLAVARTRLQDANEEFEARIAEARNEIAPAKIANAPYRPSLREIEVQVRNSFKKRLARIQSIDKSDAKQLTSARIRLEELKGFLRAVQRSRGLDGIEAPLDVGWHSEALSEKFNWSISKGSQDWNALTDFVARSQIEAAERQIQLLEGRPAAVHDADFGPDQFLRDESEKADPSSVLGPPVSLEALFAAYRAERKPSAATIKSFRAKIRSFVNFLGHDDARRISKRDVAQWRDHLLTVGGASGIPLDAKTVRDTYLSAVKSALTTGVGSGQLNENVASGVSVAGRKRKARLRSQSFTADEVKAILRATLDEHSPRLSKERQLARRWLPWLSAYTGARVDEMAQLRGEDIQLVDDIWVVRITPEAGGTKDGNARMVALHPHLTEQGFPDVAKANAGPIFFDPRLSRGGSEANRQSKKVGEHIARWVRNDIGITDKTVQPNHAWRHRFKTVARDCRMAPDVRDYIQGHVPRTEGEAYGEFSPKATLGEISLIPKIDVWKGQSATACRT